MERRGEDEAGKPPVRWFCDGEWHVRGSSDCCSGGIAGKCRKCGGRLHMQPVYGGLCCWCEDCGDEP